MKAKKMTKKQSCGAVLLLVAGAIVLSLGSCGSTGGDNKENGTTGSVAEEQAAVTDPADPMSNKGIGPVATVELGALDATLAEKGNGIFKAKCTACHKMDARHVGPPLGGVTKRRTPEWIMNMILNPSEMLMKDPIAKDLLGTYAAQMANQNLSQEEARAVLEFFRQTDQ